MKPENTGKKSGRGSLWKPGQSGNPSGKPKGTRHKATQIAQGLIGAESENVIRKVIEKALDGDSVCLRLCIERLIPPMKDKPISLALPEIQSMNDSVNAMAAVLNQVAIGEITPTEGSAVAAMIETFRRTLETQELEQRISELEKRHV